MSWLNGLYGVNEATPPQLGPAQPPASLMVLPKAVQPENKPPVPQQLERSVGGRRIQSVF